MLKTYLYIPENLDAKIMFTAKAQNKSKAEVIRQALEKCITAVQQLLLKLAELGRKYKLHGPKDSSERIDELLWGRKWDNNE